MFAVARMSAGRSTAELEERSEPPEEAQRRSRFLISASATLSESLDYERTLQRVAELSVPDIADWCTVTVVDELGEARRLAVVHADPAKRELAAEYKMKFPPTEHRSGQMLDVLKRGARRAQRARHRRGPGARRPDRGSPAHHARARLRVVRDGPDGGAGRDPGRHLADARRGAHPLRQERRRDGRGAGPPRGAGDRQRAALPGGAAARGDDALLRRGEHAPLELARPRLDLRTAGAPGGAVVRRLVRRRAGRGGGAASDRHRARRQRQGRDGASDAPALPARCGVGARSPRGAAHRTLRADP